MRCLGIHSQWTTELWLKFKSSDPCSGVSHLLSHKKSSLNFDPAFVMFFSSSLFRSSGLEMLLTSNKNGCQRSSLDPGSSEQRFRSRAHHPAHTLLFAQRRLDYRAIFVSIHAPVFIWIQRKLCLGFAKYSWVFPCFITGILFLTQWYTCPLKLEYRSGIVGESEKYCMYGWTQAECFQRERYSDDVTC